MSWPCTSVRGRQGCVGRGGTQRPDVNAPFHVTRQPQIEPRCLLLPRMLLTSEVTQAWF